MEPEWSSNGRFVFRSDRSGTNEPWIASADGRARVRRRGFGARSWEIGVGLPDGRALAFTSHADGNPDVYLMQCEKDVTLCSEPRQLTQTPRTDVNPTRSADGRWIYFPLSEAAVVRSGECRPTVASQKGSPGMGDSWLVSRPTESGFTTRNLCIHLRVLADCSAEPRPWTPRNDGRDQGAVQGCSHLGADCSRVVLLRRFRRT